MLWERRVGVDFVTWCVCMEASDMFFARTAAR